jgi:hypothetical protein
VEGLETAKAEGCGRPWLPRGRPRRDMAKGTQAMALSGPNYGPNGPRMGHERPKRAKTGHERAAGPGPTGLAHGPQRLYPMGPTHDGSKVWSKSEVSDSCANLGQKG